MNTNKIPYRVPAPPAIQKLVGSEHYKNIVRGTLEKVGSRNLSLVPMKCGNIKVLFSKKMPTRVNGVAVVDYNNELINISGATLDKIIQGNEETIEKVCRGIARAVELEYV